MFFSRNVIRIKDELFRLVGQTGPDEFAFFKLPKSDDKVSIPPFVLKAYSRKALTAVMGAKVESVKSDPFVPSFESVANIVESDGKPKAAIPGELMRQREEQEELDRRIKAVEYVLESGSLCPLLTRRGRVCRIREAAEKFNFHHKQMQRMVSRYLTYGMLGAALRLFHWKKGGPRKNPQNKLGRRAKHHGRGLRGGCNVTPEIRAAVFPFVEDFFNKLKKEGKKPILEDAYHAFIVIHYRDGYENGKPQLKDAEEVMSWPLFRSIFYTARKCNVVTWSIIKHGDRHEKDHREKLGSEAQRELCAGSCYQCDFTIADFEAIHPIYREARPIGRPTGGLAADVVTSASVGGLVTMADPSAMVGLMLLENAISDKTELLASFGLDIKTHPIPGGILPWETVWDNGELRRTLKRAIPRELKVLITNRAPGRCEHKGTIETHICELLGHQIRLLDGYRRIDDRRRPHCAIDGKMDPIAFYKVMLLAMARRNTRLIQGKYQTMAMRMDNIPPVPIEMWLHSIQNSSGSMRIAPAADSLRFLLLPRAEAGIDGDGKGLVFEGMYYYNAMLHEQGVFADARRVGKGRIMIGYDPRLIDVIYVISSSKRQQIQPCFLSDRSAWLRGRKLSFFDAKGLMDESSFLNALQVPEQTQGQINFKSAVSDIMEEQKDKNKAAKKTPRSFAPILKKDARKLAGLEDKQNSARVLVDPALKVIYLPNQNGYAGAASQAAPAPTALLTARQRALQNVYAKRA